MTEEVRQHISTSADAAAAEERRHVHTFGETAAAEERQHPISGYTPIVGATEIEEW